MLSRPQNQIRTKNKRPKNKECEAQYVFESSARYDVSIIVPVELQANG